MTARSDSSSPETESGAAAEALTAGVLTREQMRERILAQPPLVSEWRDLDVQLQPNGFDLSLAAINQFAGPGSIAVDNANRMLPNLQPVDFTADGWVELAAGPYQIIFNEVVNLPLDLMALGRPRSSLGRCGVTIHTAVWDAGYVGRSTALLSVLNPAGFRVQRDARVLQLVFLTTSRRPEEGYRGVYQGENLSP